nr:hypothetical protein [Acholeplasmatales bacterium]
HNMASLYEQSINKNQVFDYRILKKKANTLFVYLRKMNAPVLVEKETQTGSDSNLVTWLDEASPSAILDVVSPNYPPNYLGTINEIYEALENTLPRGVINCMIIKTLRDKGGDLPAVTYFKRVADSWISDSVLATKDAVKYITTVKENGQSKSSRKNKERDDAYNSSNNIEVVWEEL